MSTGPKHGNDAMLILVRKLTEAAEADSPPAAHYTYRLFVTDVRSGGRFLIDSGAEISVIPPGNGPRRSSDIVLNAATGTKIATYGPRELHLTSASHANLFGRSRPRTSLDR